MQTQKYVGIFSPKASLNSTLASLASMIYSVSISEAVILISEYLTNWCRNAASYTASKTKENALNVHEYGSKSAGVLISEIRTIGK